MEKNEEHIVMECILVAFLGQLGVQDQLRRRFGNRISRVTPNWEQHSMV
jgi:hypothetical protein